MTGRLWALAIAAIVIGAAGVIGTQAMVAQTDTEAFCSGACHSMAWAAHEYRQSIHYANPLGVRADCHDCHVPHSYPELLWYKAKAGLKDAIAEMRGTIATEEKFKQERLRLAQAVWAEFRETGSANCRYCHAFSPEIVAKQAQAVQPMHTMMLEKQATCIDCHKGVAHAAPQE
jgi:nitrate/TMAO reductase-like tetraheme cytochrome c subunit